MKQGKRLAISLLLTALVGAVGFYITLPAINLRNEEFYLFLIGLCVVFIVANAMLGGEKGSTQRVITREGKAIHIDAKGILANTGKVPKILAGILFAVLLLGNLISWVGFHAKDYYNLLAVENGDFAQDVAEISYNEIPMLDEASAIQLGRRTLGSINSTGQYANLVSQFEPSDNYTQINFQGQPVRVASLEYGDIIKWFNNRSEGLPGYIVVNMVTQEAELRLLDEGIKYATCDHFSRNLYRHVRFQYPTYMFGAPTFELDEDGQPYWVCPRIVKRIGLFGGTDIQGAVLVNAVTGESRYYEEVPTWVDRVYLASLIMEQYDFHGTLINGFINSFFGEKGCTVTTDGYNYIVIGDDVYMYTGVTSTGSDESNVGFILSNQRTKETKFYPVNGAEEYSAMSSAEGAVQHLAYTATFPILLNISDQPTYFMALKDSAQLVKMYAMVNVADYQLTATGTSVLSCQEAYEQLLAQNGIAVENPVDEQGESNEITGTVAEIRSAVINGNTWYYIRLEGQDWFCALSAADNQQVVLLNVGDSVTVAIPAELTSEIRNGTLR